MDRTILIFSASFGNGHHQAARALKEKLCDAGHKVEIIDTFYSLHPLLHKAIMESYLKLIKISPTLWQKLYYHTEERPWYKLFDKLGLFYGEQLYVTLTKYNCPYIISTHYFVTALLASLKRKQQLNIPLYAIITDFSIHPAYLRDEVDGYFTAANLSKHMNTTIELPLKKFFSTGIPIRTISPLTKQKGKLRLDLTLEPNRKTVMIAGGGVGLTNYIEVIKSLEEYNETLQLLCMIGNNRKIKQKIDHLNSKHDIKVIGFTDQFTKYMQASDVLISKAGGLTMAEALSCELPVIIHQPIPGHEEENTQFLINAGTALEAKNQKEIPFLLKKILFKKGYYEEMQLNATKIKQPNAAKDIIAQINHNERVPLKQAYEYNRKRLSQ